MLNVEVRNIYQRNGISITLRRGLEGNRADLVVNYQPEADQADAVIEIDSNTLAIDGSAVLLLESVITQLLGEVAAREFIGGLIEALLNLAQEEIVK